MAKNQNTIAKRQREMEKKRKQEEKRQRKNDRKAEQAAQLLEPQTPTAIEDPENQTTVAVESNVDLLS
ncbi:MAG: hypothetical protein HKN47_11205 [Pirellulaceae bacterium]|nr:hypothetical protein [Pirellulaceae bacterium]